MPKAASAFTSTAAAATSSTTSLDTTTQLQYLGIVADVVECGISDVLECGICKKVVLVKNLSHHWYDDHAEETITITEATSPSAIAGHSTLSTDVTEFLPRQFRRIIHPGDQALIAEVLYHPKGQLRDQLPNKNWYEPPGPHPPAGSVPDPDSYFHQRLLSALFIKPFMRYIARSGPSAASGTWGIVCYIRRVQCRLVYLLCTSPRSHSVHVP